MLIRLELDQTHPPTGTVTTGEETEVPFEGWLGLLATLSELLGPEGGLLEMTTRSNED
jgi:hypothetical protein